MTYKYGIVTYKYGLYFPFFRRQDFGCMRRYTLYLVFVKIEWLKLLREVEA